MTLFNVSPRLIQRREGGAPRKDERVMRAPAANPRNARLRSQARSLANSHAPPVHQEGVSQRQAPAAGVGTQGMTALLCQPLCGAQPRLRSHRRAVNTYAARTPSLPLSTSSSAARLESMMAAPPLMPLSALEALPALAPAFLTLSLTFLLGALVGFGVRGNRVKRNAVAAASNRAESGAAALKRARDVLGVFGEPELDASLMDSQALQARADAAESGLRELQQRASEGGGLGDSRALKVLSTALANASVEFEEALAEKEEAMEEAALLREILEQKEAQMQALERMLGSKRA
jgi:hypothetical protein